MHFHLIVLIDFIFFHHRLQSISGCDISRNKNSFIEWAQ
jgi:hypothetical protein